MINLIEQLEDLRKRLGVSKADMARRIEANSLQRYNNWVYRGSLPSAWEKRAIQILKDEGEEVALDAEILNKIRDLPDDKARLIIDLIDGMLDQKGGR